MIANILLTASQVGTLFLMMGVGFALAKWNKLTPAGVSQMSLLLLNVATPCIIMDALQVERTGALLQAMRLGAVVMLGIYILWMVLSPLLFRRLEEGARTVLQFGMIYGNTGFMGLPLIQAVLGTEALVFATTPYILFNVLSWSHGVAVIGGRANISAKKLLLNPGILGSAAGLALFFLNLRLPPLAGDAVHYLGSLNTPLAMVVIGAQMAGTDLAATFRSAKLYVASAMRLVVFPLTALLLLLPLHLDPLMYATYVILAATPTAGVTAIFAQQYQRDTAAAAQLITLSTLLCVATLPAFAALAQALGG